MADKLGTETDALNSFDPRSSETFFDHIPLNKRNYKYNLCRVAHDDTSNIESSQFVNSVHISPFDRLSNIVYTDSLNSLKTVSNTPSKGWASAKSNVCLRDGLVYFEFQMKQIDPLKECNTRVGISQRNFPIAQPIGSDLNNSVGIRDMTFERVYNRKRDMFLNNNDSESFNVGDSIGFLVNLPSISTQYKQSLSFVKSLISKETDEFELFQLNRYLEDIETIYLEQKTIHKERVLIKYKNETYFESQDYVKNEQFKDEDLIFLTGSFIKVFKNGVYKGDLANDEKPMLFNFLPPFSSVSFDNTRYKQVYNKLIKNNDIENIRALIPKKYYDDGSLGYYPTISLFNDAQVQLNGSVHDMVYYDIIKQFVISDDSILNKHLTTLEDVYLAQKEQTKLYDTIECEKKKQQGEMLTKKMDETDFEPDLKVLGLSALNELNDKTESQDIEMEL
ncbi:hypothetical protein QEN19_001250 [Hanseniaspora menglaensis]